jgi:uncharacterized protein (DUF2384 family)
MNRWWSPSAADVLARDERARAWLHTPSPLVEDRSSRSLLDTISENEQVRTLLLRIERGMLA